jgi:hypothetical protein
MAGAELAVVITAAPTRRTFSESHCTMSSSSFFASSMLCASSINLRVTTTFVLAMLCTGMSAELVQWARCGVDVDLLAVLVPLLTQGASKNCDDTYKSLCIDV